MNKKRFLLIVALVLAVTAVFSTGPAAFAQTGSDLVITGVVDGPLSGGVPKAVEFYVLNDITDLSQYGFGSANNGGGSDGEEFTFPAVAASAGSYIYVASETMGFNSFFGFDPDYTSSAASINGDDAIELFQSGVVVDVFGDVNVDGTGEPWEYKDGWAYRVDGTGPDGSTFILANWTFSGPDALDGETSNDTAAMPFPIGTYTTSVTIAAPVINEFVANHTGTDTHEFIEVFGTSGADYSTFTVLEIEGDSSGTGTVDGVFNVSTMDSAGYWTTGFLNNEIENGSITLMLVEEFTGSQGDDLDTNNDGILDVTPWTTLVDDVAVFDGGSSDQTYSSVVLTRGFDGNSFTPGGASRIPNGVDTDTVGDWMRNDYDGAGLPGFSGSPVEGEAYNTPLAINEAVPPPPFGACGDPFTPIYDIQSSGSSSPIDGQVVETEGVITGDFQASNQLNGFFIQDPVGDGDSATSDGIFVYAPGNSLNVGDAVRVKGTVDEFFGWTEITSVSNTAVCGTGSVASTNVSLPVADNSIWEQYESMLLTFPQTLSATDNFNLGRFGEVSLSVNGRLFNPTQIVDPGTAANDMQDLNDRSRILLDDGSTVQNPLPLPPYLGPDNTLRAGDTVDNLIGVLSYGFGSYRLQPTADVNFTRVNEREAAPADVGGTITVAGFNVLNYFTTIDDSGPICGPSGDLGCRGADTEEEFVRQRTKIINALSIMDVDVVGLVEIENNETAAIQNLVDGLNDVMGAGTYSYIDTGFIGTDAIKVALIYKPASVTPVGSYAILDSSVDPNFNDDKNRPVLAQTFADANDGTFTVAVNHLKSKGSNCDSLGDPDTGDGQGNCNITRTNAALAMVNWLAGDPTNSGDADFLIIGDLNSYAMEDPIQALEDSGFTNLLGNAEGPTAHSYVFFGQAGTLDYALSTGPLLTQVTGVTAWHINADEPRALDYNNFNQPDFYQPDAYRASDHDPVIVGLDLSPYAVNADGCYVLAVEGSPFDGPANWVTAVNKRFDGKWWLLQEGLSKNECLEIHGTDRSDLLFGASGDDTFFGYGNNDLLLGRTGDDTFTGGDGRDRFIGNSGYDTVLDYVPGVDRCSTIENGCE